MYDTLLEEIASAQIRPGDPLVVPQIAKELDVSETPVREAIERLITLGLARRRAHHGCTVADPSASELSELFEVREALEGMAARLMAERGQKSQMVALRKIHEDLISASERKHFGEYCLSDYRFHSHVIRSCGNRQLAESGNAEVLLLLSYFHLEPYRPRGIMAPWETRTQDNHIDIVNAIATHDSDAAEAIMRFHIRRANEGLRRWLGERKPAGALQPAAGEEVSGED